MKDRKKYQKQDQVDVETDEMLWGGGFSYINNNT